MCDDARLFLFREPGVWRRSRPIACPISRRAGPEVFGVADARPFIAPSPADRSGRRYHGEPGRRRESRQAPRAASSSASCCACWRKPERPFWSTRAAAPRSGSASNAPCILACEPTTALSLPSPLEIARSKLFVGYDSAGGHVASACGVPLISDRQRIRQRADARALAAQGNRDPRRDRSRRSRSRCAQRAYMYIPPLTSSTCPVM